MPIATSNFLVPNGTFIVVLLAFLVVLGIIGKKVLPALNTVLNERQEQIRGELEAADRAKADAEVAVARQAAIEDVTARVGEIVLSAAERVIGREIQAADHQDLIEEAIAAVRSESTTGAAAGAAGGSR